MSLAIWPPIAAEDLKKQQAETQDKMRMLIDFQRRELDWIVDHTVKVCRELKHGLDDCYALLAPIDPGSTLVMSTPRNEKVKGTITRVGTRLVKSLRMLPAHSLALAPNKAIHINALDTIHTNLTQAIDLLTVTLSHNDSSPPEPNVLASALTLLSQSLTTCVNLLKGPDPNGVGTSWQTSSVPLDIFSPPLDRGFSVHVGLQECCVVLALRVLEGVDAPVNIGMKLGLAIGTVRRLEHDEMDTVFRYSLTRGGEASSGGAGGEGGRQSSGRRDDRRSIEGERGGESEEVYVREKVRVDSADPSLISLYSKLGSLNHMLGQARGNLAAVMGTEVQN